MSLSTIRRMNATGVVLRCLHKDAATVVDELEEEVIRLLPSDLMPWLVTPVVFVEITTRNFFLLFEKKDTGFRI
jgi:hypothetical protein